MPEQMLQQTDVGSDDWSLGPPNAPVTLLEYADFQCPYCAPAAEVLAGLIADEPARFRLIFRQFPLTSMHRHALVAAQAAEAAGSQGKFWEMHHLLFAHQNALRIDDLAGYSAELGLDVDRFEEDLVTERYLDDVKADVQRGLRDGVRGTPTIFINGVRYDGGRDRASILAAIDRPNRRQLSARRHA